MSERTIDVNYAIIKQGDTWGPHVFTFKDSAGNNIDVSGRAWLGQVRKSRLSSSVDAVVTFDTTNAASGSVAVSILASATSSIPCGETRDHPDSKRSLELQWSQGSVTETFYSVPCWIDSDGARS